MTFIEAVHGMKHGATFTRRKYKDLALRYLADAEDNLYCIFEGKEIGLDLSVEDCLADDWEVI